MGAVDRQTSMTTHLPALDSGLIHVRSPAPRSTAPHRLALSALAGREGTAYWIDARNAASVHLLRELTDRPGHLDSLRIARAFTAYQHHTLVRQVAKRADPRTGLLVAPNLASLYRDDDVPAHERDPLFDAAVAVLDELGRAVDCPVLATTTGEDDLVATVAERATTDLDCERTREGYRFVGDDFETTAYRGEGYWQTTIPYWVDLFGVADPEGATAPADPSALVPEVI